MFSRLLDSWNTEQLSDVWREIVGVSSRVDTLDMKYQTLQDLMDDLQRRLEGQADNVGIEARLLALETQLGEAEGGLVDTATFQDFESSYVDTLRRLEQEVSDLSLQLPTLTEDDWQAMLDDLVMQLEVLRTNLFSLEQQVAQPNDYASISTVTDLESKLAQVETKLQPLQAQLATLEQMVRELQTQVQEKNVPEVIGDITVATGFVGQSWRGSFGVGLETSFGRLDAILSDRGFEGRAKGYVLPSLALQGRVNSSTGLGMVGLETTLGGLDIGLLAGTDDGLAGTLYMVHNGDAANAVIPGLNFFAAGSLGEASDTTRFMVRLHAAYTFQGDGFYIEPSFAYETGSVTESYSLLAPGLGAGVRIGDSVTLALELQYVFANSSKDQQTHARSFPQGTLELAFDSGAFLNLTVEGGGPGFTSLPSFDFVNPALPVDLLVGATVGYTFRIE